MKVSELISKLSALDHKLEVLVAGDPGEGDQTYPVTDAYLWDGVIIVNAPGVGDPDHETEAP